MQTDTSPFKEEVAAVSPISTISALTPLPLVAEAGPIELGSTGTLGLGSSSINANGGTVYHGSTGDGGGGGGGGSISLLGQRLILDGDELDAIGGQGDSGYEILGQGEDFQGAGGGGGGGLIDLVGSLLDSNYIADVQGGDGFNPGGNGVVFLSVPEPSGIVSGGFASAAGLLIGIARKGRRAAAERTRSRDPGP